MIYGFRKIDVQFSVKRAELSPNFSIEPLTRRAHHNGGTALARISIRPNPVLSTDGNKKPNGPSVRKRKLHLDCGLRILPQPLLNPSNRCRCCGTFAVSACTSEQCLKLRKTGALLVVIDRQIQLPSLTRLQKLRAGNSMRHDLLPMADALSTNRSWDDLARKRRRRFPSLVAALLLQNAARSQPLGAHVFHRKCGSVLV